MLLEIDEEVIKHTFACNASFCCLAKEGHLCRIRKFSEDNSLLLECLHEGCCNYKASFGNSIICACPTRKDIFHRYGY